MRAVVQRVNYASVKVDDQIVSNIDKGLLVLAGVENDDSNEDITWLAKKIAQLRIFNDSNGVMNLSVNDISGDIIVVSQFTLHASTKKGNRPSYIKAAKPDIAVPVLNKFKAELDTLISGNVQSGEFGADMKVELLNDGPVTIVIDTKNKE